MLVAQQAPTEPRRVATEPRRVASTEGASTTTADSSTPESLPSTTSSPLTPTSELPDSFPPSEGEEGQSEGFTVTDNTSTIFPATNVANHAPLAAAGGFIHPILAPGQLVGPQVAVATAATPTQPNTNGTVLRKPDSTHGWAPLSWAEGFLERRVFKTKEEYLSAAQENSWHDGAFVLSFRKKEKKFPLLRVLCTLCNLTVDDHVDGRAVWRHCDTLTHLESMSERLAQNFEAGNAWKCPKCNKHVRKDLVIRHKVQCRGRNNSQTKRKRNASQAGADAPAKKRVRAAVVAAPAAIVAESGIVQRCQRAYRQIAPAPAPAPAPGPAFHSHARVLQSQYQPGAVLPSQHQHQQQLQYFPANYQPGPPPTAASSSGSRSAQPQDEGPVYPFTFAQPLPSQLAQAPQPPMPVPVPGAAPPYWQQFRNAQGRPVNYLPPPPPPTPAGLRPRGPMNARFSAQGRQVDYLPPPPAGLRMRVTMQAPFPLQGDLNVPQAGYMPDYYGNPYMAPPAAVTAPPDGAFESEGEDDTDATQAYTVWPDSSTCDEVEVSAEELEALKSWDEKGKEEKSEDANN